jgi:hypothetical protein
VRAGLAQRLLGARDVPLHDPAGVARDPVDDLRCRDAGRVDHVGRELDSVLLVGQVLADQPPLGGVAEPLAEGAVVVGAPRPAVRERSRERTAGAAERPPRAAHEPARRVGLVELHRLDRGALLPLPALEVVVEDAEHRRERVQHQVPADQARGVGEPVRARRGA